MSNLLKGRTIIVTGSSSGIGLAIAKAVYDEGANIMLHGRNSDILSKLACELGSRSKWIAADLADEKSIDRITTATISEFGGIDGLVNNAGIFPRSTIDSDIIAQFDDVFHINTLAPLLLCQALVQDCRRRKVPGAIVNIGSINAYCGADMILVYSMSKGALMTMSRNLGDSLGKELIRVNQLNVGWTLTEGEKKIQKQMGSPDDWHLHLDEVSAPRGHLLMPVEIAQHAVFWLSDASAPVSGSVYEIEQYPVIGRNRAAG